MMMRNKMKFLNDDETTLARIWIDDKGLHIKPISNNKQKENEQDCIKKDGIKEL